MKPRPALFAAAAGVELLLLSFAGAHGDFARHGQTLRFVPLILLAGVAFLFAVRWFETLPSRFHSRTLWAFAIGLRVAMLPCAPGDDFWRYAWEGRMQNAGENPYRRSPSAPELAHLRDEHWARINHPETAAIYPPAAELAFAAITRVSSSPYCFKIVFIAADLLTLALLVRLVKPTGAAWYAWNPAVVYAFAGAAHYDSLMLLALTGAVVALYRAGGEIVKWQLASVLCLAVAISLKLVPAIFFPVWAFALGARAWSLAVCVAMPVVLAIPFGGIAATMLPLRDFADVTRFNELLVWILPNPWQRNWPVMTLLGIVLAVIVVRLRCDWPRSALWVMGATLLLSPVLHPWYATWILPLAIWQRQPVWTVLSISTLAAFLLWETTSLWTAWQPNPLTRAIVIIPLLLALFFRTSPMSLRTADYDYTLPDALIARHPSACREDARMLVMHRATQTIEHRTFLEFPRFVHQDDVVVLNDTRVIPARVYSDDGRIELLFLETIRANTWKCLVKPGRRMREGALVHVHDVVGVVIGICPEGERIIEFRGDIDVDAAGELPLPPYFEREVEPADAERYQTVFARERGAVAAPTAGLHFTPEILEQIPHAFLTLHIGVGTFRPVQTEDIIEHRMHSERFRISENAAAKINAASRVIAVGTTTTRVLESRGLPLAACEGATDIFIHPPYEFRVIDELLTNFHLPKSTLLMLVSAFAGREFVLRAYEEAIRERYRFYSYGDCMLIV